MNALAKIQIIHGDITQVEVDAIVNAANNTLLGGFGVDGAIHRVGGKEILEACKKIGGCETGKAVITPAGKLPARYVIHTVGPVWYDGNHEETITLETCYRNSLQLALQHHCKTISFPNISTGAYGFPKLQAAKIAVSTVIEFLKIYPQMDQVILVCFTRENYIATLEAFNTATH